MGDEDLAEHDRGREQDLGQAGSAGTGHVQRAGRRVEVLRDQLDGRGRDDEEDEDDRV